MSRPPGEQPETSDAAAEQLALTLELVCDRATESGRAWAVRARWSVVVASAEHSYVAELGGTLDPATGVVRLNGPPSAGWKRAVSRAADWRAADRSGLPAEEEFGLTARQLDVVRLLAQGLSNADIAEALGISPHTARRHTEHVLRKLGLHSRSRVAARVRGGMHDADLPRTAPLADAPPAYPVAIRLIFDVPLAADGGLATLEGTSGDAGVPSDRQMTAEPRIGTDTDAGGEGIAGDVGKIGHSPHARPT
jgi:DNA-binding CsgD family transcriptional regulator